MTALTVSVSEAVSVHEDSSESIGDTMEITNLSKTAPRPPAEQPLPRRKSLSKILKRRRFKRDSDESACDIFTDVDSSVNSSLMLTALNGGSSNRRIPGGCLKIITQRDSVGVYYGPVNGNERSVRWGNIEMHSHSMILGDNPCPAGPAVCLSWTSFNTISVSVHDYEASLPPRRCLQQLVFPKSFRTELLKESGYSRGEIRISSELGAEIRKHREKNARQTMAEKLEDLSLRLRGKNTRKSVKPLPYEVADLSDSIRSVKFE
jgi:hypothetical protein